MLARHVRDKLYIVLTCGVFCLRYFGVRLCWAYLQRSTPDVTLKQSSDNVLFIVFALCERLHSSAELYIVSVALCHVGTRATLLALLPDLYKTSCLRSDRA